MAHPEPAGQLHQQGLGVDDQAEVGHGRHRADGSVLTLTT